MDQKTALLVLDVQVNMFADECHVYRREHILDVIQTLITRARSQGARVIYVRNNGGPGDVDEPGSPGWEIHPQIPPLEDDPVVDKSSPDAFEGTSLQDLLESLEISRLVVVGMQTEMCVAASCRRAVELGYEVTLVEDGHTTFDWDEIQAVDAIAKCNLEMAEISVIQPAAEIVF